MEAKVEVFAKINLALNVTGENGGYHALDTVMASVGISNLITLSPREDGKNEVRFSNGIAPEGTNAYKAAELLRKRFHLPGASIYIEERIPTGGGLGGSSADAAGVIHGFRGLFGIRESDAIEVASQIGSDVPFMLRGGFGRLTGTHRELGYFAGGHGEVLLCGKGSVSTGECFRRFDSGRYDGTVTDVDKMLFAMQEGGLEAGREFFANALYAPACELNPEIARIKALMEQCSLTACMTGSGSFVFGVGEGLKQAAAELEKNGYAPKIVRIMQKGIKCE